MHRFFTFLVIACTIFPGTVAQGEEMQTAALEIEITPLPSEIARNHFEEGSVLLQTAAAELFSGEQKLSPQTVLDVKAYIQEVETWVYVKRVTEPNPDENRVLQLQYIELFKGYLNVILIRTEQQ